MKLKIKDQKPKTHIKNSKTFLYFCVCVFNIWFFIFSIANASVPSDWYYGRRTEFSDAQSNSLAGNDLFKPSIYFGNPIEKNTNKLMVGISYDFGFLQDRWTKQVYDNFDNAIGELAFVENLFTSGRLGNISVLYPWQYANIGLNVRPQYNYEYFFEREFRDDFYTKIGNQEIKILGTVYNASLMFGKEFLEKFGVGAGVNYYFGSRKYSFDSIMNNVETIAETTGSPSGIGFTAGISAMPIEQLLIHFDFQSGVNLKKWLNETSIKYPTIYNLSIAYLAAGEIPTKIGVDAKYSDWKIIDSTYQSTVEIGLGVEHTMFNSVALRYGFRFEPSFVPPVVHQGAVYLGWGFAVGNVTIDIGASIKRRIIGNENIMPSGSDNTLRIYQNSGEILIGANIPIQI